jgi:hypothetical protein
MRERLTGSAAGVAALVFSLICILASWCGARAQAAPPQAAAKSQTAPTDLSGVWRRSRRPPDNAKRYTLGDVVNYLTHVEPPMTAWGEAKFKTNKPNLGPRAVPLAESNDPVISCFPPSVPRLYTQRLGAPFEIMQIPGRVMMFFEFDHFVRAIYTDGRQHPKDLNPTWMGDAIGKWEGNTLVVDTVGFNDKSWLDSLGHPHSDALHLVERIRRTSHDAMTDDITIDDPKAYTKPWNAHLVFELKPDWNIAEYVCEDFLNFKDLQTISESKK